MTSTNGVEVIGATEVAFVAGDACLSGRCRLRTVSEHLLSFDVVESTSPPPGTMVDLEVSGRPHRSTVQASTAAGFVLLRPRELDSHRSG